MKRHVGKFILFGVLIFGLESCFLLESISRSEGWTTYPSTSQTDIPNKTETPKESGKPSPTNNKDSGNNPKGIPNSLERAILAELNLVRQNPSNYAAQVMKHYRNSSAAADECYRELLQTKKMAAFEFETGLYQAADWFVQYQAKSGAIGHDSSVQGYRTPGDRISQFGIWNGSWGENISYGYNEARAIVVQLLIDDGVPGRGHRKNILNPSFKKIGIATGSHAKYRFMCVMDFANAYTTYVH